MSHCCLCGLLCSLDRPATDACPRRIQWLEQLSELGPPQPEQVSSHEFLTSAPPSTPGQSSSAAQLAAQVETIAACFHPSRRSLIWIDAADVHTVRCAVALAAAARGTIHVGQSTGAAVGHRVLTRQGWLGSSLAEVASHADLIISLGSNLSTEAPLLAQRFFSPAVASGRAQWCHIDSHASTHTPTSQPSTSQAHIEPSPHWTTVWPRAQWYEQLTQIMLGLQNEQSSSTSAAGGISNSARELLGKLRSAKNTVWLWDVDEFRDDIDELCIQRLLGISRLLSQSARCSLLGLDAQVGRVTASETLLWLTGCSGTAQFDGQHWSQPHESAEMALEQWPSVFDSIVVLRSLPSVYPLPSLQANHFIVPGLSLLPDHVADDSVTRVASVGVDSDGHVMRGDRATMLYCEAYEPLPRGVPKTSQLPTAAEMLERVLRRVQSREKTNAN